MSSRWRVRKCPRPLRQLDGLEQRSKISVAESLVAAALDELVEEWARPFVSVEARSFTQEDLEHVLVVFAVDENLELFERRQILLHVSEVELGQALRQEAVVVLVGRQESDATGTELANGGDDVREPEREVLDAGTFVVVAKTRDLAFAEVGLHRLV